MLYFETMAQATATILDIVKTSGLHRFPPQPRALSAGNESSAWSVWSPNVAAVKLVAVKNIFVRLGAGGPAATAVKPRQPDDKHGFSVALKYCVGQYVLI